MSDRYAGLRQEWSAWIEQWERSGLSGAEFCRRNELSVLRFYAWRRRLRPDSGRAASKLAVVGGTGPFVALRFRDEATPCGIAVVFASGLRLELSSGFDSGELARAVQALGGAR